MPPSTDSSQSTKLPLAPNMDQILNRISLGLAKHERVLKTLRKPPASSATPTTSSGFSSLAVATAPRPQPRPSSRAESVSAAATSSGSRASASAEAAEFAADRALPPNAGVGWNPSPSTGATAPGSREDKILRARLLGGRGRKDGDEASRTGGKRGRRGGANGESESEEDEGRSGLGRGKRRKAGGDGSSGGGAAVPGDVGVGSGVGDSVTAAAPCGTAVHGGNELDSSLDRAGDEVESGQTPQSGSGAVSTDLTEAPQKKRKKRKNKKSKGSTQSL